MDTSLKRILAFAIDILLVTIVVSALTKWTNIDPYKEKYNNAYEEYNEIAKKVNEDKEDVTKYEDRIVELNHDIYKYRVVSSSISIISLVLYFGVAQFALKGQTIGKKILHLKVESNKDKKLNIFHYLLRSIFLCNIIFSIIIMISVYVVSGMKFYYVVYFVSLLESTFYMVNLLMVVFKKDHRGIHDLIAGTKVIDLKPLITESNELEEVKAIETKASENKPVKKSNTTKKKTSKKKVK